MSNKHSLIILKSWLLAVLLIGGLRAALTGCSQAIVHFPDYTCREEAAFGEGSSGITYVILKDEKPYILKAQDASVAEALQKANIDLQFLNLFQGDKYIVQLIKAKVIGGYLFEILEFGVNGDLLHYFERNKALFKDKANILSMFSKILQGVATMHQKNVVHADLKLENIVINEKGDPYLIDFDLSIAKNSEGTGRGTYEFMDPVIMDNWGKRRTTYNEFRDIYSLGVILYYLDQGTYPFKGSSRFAILEEVRKNVYTFRKGTDYDIVAIVDSCLKIDEDKRKRLFELIEMTDNALNNQRNVVLDAPLRLRNDKETPEWLEKYAPQPEGEDINGELNPAQMLMIIAGVLVAMGLLIAGLGVCIGSRIIVSIKSLVGEPRDQAAAVASPLQAEQMA